MQDPRAHSGARSPAGISPASSWTNLVVPALPVLACFLGGATVKSIEGVVVALLGLLLLIKPPRTSHGWVTNAILVALALCGAIAFLPARWFFQPEWRTALVNDFGIPLGVDLTAQPWLTLGCFLSFVAGLSWLYYTTTQELELRATRFQLRVFASGIVLLAATCIALYLAHVAPPFWHNIRGFGPFPNRNQTGDLFGITAIVTLACGQDDMRHSRKRWIAWLFAFALLIAAIILNFSRAGVLILIAGSALWIAAVGLRKKGTAAPIALGFSVLLLVLTALLVFGGETFERFNLRTPSAPGMSSDFRWLIFRDAWHMIRASPWCGVGLGNFEPVFAIFREASFGDSRAHHPESDWLWLWAEVGWPAVFLVVAGFIAIVPRIFPLKEGTNQRLRLAALIGAISFALHGLVDVSAHRVGTAYSAILLFGLSLHRPLCLPSSRWVPVIFRFIGAALLVTGTAWSVAARNGLALPGAVGADNAKRLAVVANRGRNYVETIDLTTRALQWAPLDWQLYFLRALGEVQARRPAAAALDDFRRARFLEPNAYEVPLEEGNVWRKPQPVLALTAWREALRRAGSRRGGLYATLLAQTSVQDPSMNRMLEQLSNGQPGLIVAFLDGVAGDRFNAGLDRLLARDPNLQMLTRDEMRKLFSLWAERGDLARLAREAAEHPAWNSYAWEGLAKFYVSKKDFHSAFALARKFGESPALPQVTSGLSIDELQKQYFASPNNYAAGYAFYHEQMQLGKFDNALVTARHFTERADSPAYFHFLEAEAWAAEENWERAWNAWLAYREAARKR